MYEVTWLSTETEFCISELERSIQLSGVILADGSADKSLLFSSTELTILIKKNCVYKFFVPEQFLPLSYSFFWCDPVL